MSEFYFYNITFMVSDVENRLVFKNEILSFDARQIAFIKRRLIKCQTIHFFGITQNRIIHFDILCQRCIEKWSIKFVIIPLLIFSFLITQN